MNVSLPAEMKKWVDAQVSRGGYSTASEYVRQLLREERLRRVREEINDNLQRAVESGDPTPMTAKDWQDIRRDGSSRRKGNGRRIAR